MNSVNLIGRLVRDPEVMYSKSENPTTIAKFTIAINRVPGKGGQDRGVDYPRITAFGSVAEIVEKYCNKGKQVAIIGHLQTGSYEKDGRKVYTTEVIATNIELLGGVTRNNDTEANATASNDSNIPDGFEPMDDEDIPF